MTGVLKRNVAGLVGILSFLLVPHLAFAQGLSPLMIFLQSVEKVLAILIPILVSLAVAAFFYGLIRYLWTAAGNPEAASENKRIMYWGVIAIFVMVSLWGLVLFIGKALNIGQGGTVPLPSIGTGGSAPRTGSQPTQTSSPSPSSVDPRNDPFY